MTTRGFAFLAAILAAGLSIACGGTATTADRAGPADDAATAADFPDPAGDLAPDVPAPDMRSDAPASDAGADAASADVPDVPASDVPSDAAADAVPADAVPADAPDVPAGPPYAVGVLETDFVDTTRPTPANGDAPALPGRDLPTRVWYPALADPAAAEVQDAPADLSGAPYPLILFVHGSSGTRVAYSWFGQALARAGYVVAAADFPLTSLFTEGGASDWHVEDQPADLSFLADRLFAGDADGLPAAALDPARGYAVAGHSTGGTVTLLAAFRPAPHDLRVAAAVDFSGDACFFGDGFFSSRSVPLLAVGGSRDLYVPAPDNVVRAYDLAVPPRNLAVLRGASHIGFTDFEFPDDPGVTPTTPDDPLAQTLSAFGGGTACLPVPPPADDPSMALADQHALAAAWTRAFLDAVMKGDRAGLDALRAAGDPRVDAAWDDGPAAPAPAASPRR